jgi:hypothetical protein
MIRLERRMPRESNDLWGVPNVPGDSRESSHTLAPFYIRLYRVLHLSAIEDTYIEDTAGPDPLIAAALSVRVGTWPCASPAGHFISLPDRPCVDPFGVTTECLSNASVVWQGRGNNDAEHFRKIGPIAPQSPRAYALQRSSGVTSPAVQTTSLQ